MAIDDIVRSAIATAKAAVQDLMVEVEHRPIVGHDQDGPVYAEAWTPIDALVEDIGESVQDGELHRLTTSKLTFLQPVAIAQGDLFRVNGEELEVAQRQGLIDAGSDPRRAFMSEVYVGRTRR